MDPNAALAMIIEAAIDGDPDKLREHAEALAEWLERGGFVPADPFVREEA